MLLTHLLILTEYLMNNILSDIIKHKREEVEKRKSLISIESLKEKILQSVAPVSLCKALMADGASGIIAEYKPKSPTAGAINSLSGAADVARGYSDAGASAISILTDSRFFGSSFENFTLARNVNNRPMLQKDFITDRYQIYEARAMGADVILLIAAVLTISEVDEMASLCKSLGMECILEIHSEDELSHLCSDVNIVGINNRNLNTFEVNLFNSVRIAEYVPERFLKIAESGIASPEDVVMLSKTGFNGFLIGSHFMHSSDPSGSCREFIEKLKVLKQQQCL